MFDLIQAITEDPVPALSPQSFSPELCDFVELMLRRDPGERPTAVKLLTHPFLQRYQDQDSVALAGMVKVSPASPTEVRTFMVMLCCRPPCLLQRRVARDGALRSGHAVVNPDDCFAAPSRHCLNLFLLSSPTVKNLPVA